MRTQWIVGAASSEPVSLAAPAPPPGRVEVVAQYFLLGFTHILPNGFDHVLFVLGIFLLTSRWRSIVAQVSTFTIAHSITLALVTFNAGVEAGQLTVVAMAAALRAYWQRDDLVSPVRRAAGVGAHRARRPVVDRPARVALEAR